MKKTLNKNLTQWIIFITFAWIGSCAAATTLVKDYDQDLLIITDSSTGCVTQVVLDSTIDNCKGSQYEANCGRNGKDCVCMRKNKKVTWKIDNGADFEIIFPFDSPNATCKLKTKENDKTVTCKIDKNSCDYKYNIIVASCPGVVYDPIIVVRN